MLSMSAVSAKQGGFSLQGAQPAGSDALRRACLAHSALQGEILAGSLEGSALFAAADSAATAGKRQQQQHPHHHQHHHQQHHHHLLPFKGDSAAAAAAAAFSAAMNTAAPCSSSSSSAAHGSVLGAHHHHHHHHHHGHQALDGELLDHLPHGLSSLSGGMGGPDSAAAAAAVAAAAAAAAAAHIPGMGHMHPAAMGLGSPHGMGPHHGAMGGMSDIDTDPRELEAFAERFKQRRIKLGVTQADVGSALGNLKIPGVGSLSQSTICRFESLTLSHNNMIALKPILQAWLEEAEKAARSRQLKPELFSGGGAGERRRKRTAIAGPERRSLEAYFAVQPRPSSEKIAAIAEKLDLKKNVVRVWFCNQRQKQKRMKFAASH